MLNETIERGWQRVAEESEEGGAEGQQSGSREAAEGKQRVCRDNQRERKDCSPSRPSVSPAIITFPEGGRVVNVGGGSGCHNIVILMCWPQGGPGTPHTHTQRVLYRVVR